MLSEADVIELRDGRLVLPAAVFERCLAPCVAVALVAREDRWWLLPLHGGAGGLQIKLRNAAGDRVVEAREFFRAQGVEDGAPARRLQLAFVPAEGGFALLPAASA